MIEKIKAGREEVRVQASPWALFVYAREFGSDWYADYEAAFRDVPDSEVSDGEVLNLGDVVKAIDGLFLLKTLWACAKNADDGIPGFEAWARGVRLDMSPYAVWKLEVNALINADLFCAADEAEEG
ncbi:hypothetical protein GMI70_02840 [Eggerthellaceae bacterium zg-893]|nr:hypothetical protein [Eggerthellaceae bacterium zg-893]